ncbi:hypothetical protein [Paraburkholderia sp. BL23I1N1]|uniref:hypothetical protein n=1 Tax=Paraburkholderia sp. BL23I1N1 TaxID=1938802 RepID=UPI000E755CAD|nr:hypothetical protein [Paraburkholderia sp. BL23I1N1]
MTTAAPFFFRLGLCTEVRPRAPLALDYSVTSIGAQIGSDLYKRLMSTFREDDDRLGRPRALCALFDAGSRARLNQSNADTTDDASQDVDERQLVLFDTVDSSYTAMAASGSGNLQR